MNRERERQTVKSAIYVTLFALSIWSVLYSVEQSQSSRAEWKLCRTMPLHCTYLYACRYCAHVLAHLLPCWLRKSHMFTWQYYYDSSHYWLWVVCVCVCVWRGRGRANERATLAREWPPSYVTLYWKRNAQCWLAGVQCFAVAVASVFVTLDLFLYYIIII